MIEYLALLAIPGLAAMRVMDGGWHRLPGLNVMLWLAPSVVLGLTLNPWLAVAGLALGRQWTQGYKDWKSYGSQFIRCYPAGVFVLLCGVANYLGVYDANWIGLCVGLVAVILSNIIQPWLRAFLIARTDPASHIPNRYAEVLEGAALGLFVSVPWL